VLAWVLGGGGARGALQVGAVRFLLEADLEPDMLVGTSIGAANAAFLAIHGVNAAGLAELENTWHDAAREDLLPARSLRLTLRLFFSRLGGRPYHHVLRDFFVKHGLSPDLRFGDLSGPRLFLVTTDLMTRQVVLYGTDPDQSVLEGVLASAAIPPWVRPLEVDDRVLMDGGVVSNLPIEPAIRQGAERIIALDLFEPRLSSLEAPGFGPFFMSVLATVEQRQIELEMALAKEEGVPVCHVRLQPEEPVPVWDFSHTDDLMARGYAITQRTLAEWQFPLPWWQRLLTRARHRWSLRAD